ncbi:MAG: acyltransferase [Actinomycetota bacterium]|nr:acyltransferase [Actinomycetota bacterium]
MSRRTRYRYSPALDGVRGTAMVLFMAFHFGVAALQGAWVGINLFFVLSAYLITRLLIEEHARSGRLDLLAFYRRRARRLLPALFVLLAALGIYGALIAPPSVRGALRGDMLATLLFVQNWHLILQGDQYFDLFGAPSFLRQAWTLAVEEQFYLLVPLVVLALVRWVRRRDVQAGILLTLGLAGALWTAHIGVATTEAQTHAYYGTDTRAQALCIGAALAFWTGLRTRRADQVRLPAPVVAALGWGGLVAMGYAFFAIAPFQGFMYDDGGIFLFALAAAALVLACADERASRLRAVLGWRPFAYLGRISYGLYLWHWPILLWMRRVDPRLGTSLTVGIGICTTLAIAAASYHFVERPVINGGIRALLPRVRKDRSARGVLVCVVSAIVALAFAAGHGATPAVAAGAAAVGTGADPAKTPMLVSGTPAYVPAPVQTRVAIFGDSVPYVLVRDKPPGSYPDLVITDLSQPGCDLMQSRYANRSTSVQPAACLHTKRDLGTLLRGSGARRFVLFASMTMAFPHAAQDGSTLDLDDPGYRALVASTLSEYRATARAAGVTSMSVVTVPCRDSDLSQWPIEFRSAFAGSRTVAQVTDPTRLNSVITGWAARNGVGVIDLYHAVCPDGRFQPRIHGIQLYQDQVHPSVPGASMMWTWLAPQMRDAAMTTTGSARPAASNSAGRP